MELEAAPSSSDRSGRQTRPQPQSRKRTYLARREERAELLKEVAFLEERVAFLRQLFEGRATGNGDDDDDDDEAECVATKTLRGNAALCQATAVNRGLQDAVLKNQLMHAGMKSLMAEANRPQWNAPLYSHIRLGADFSERFATVQAIKLSKRLTAYNLVQERTRFLDLSQPYSNEETFTNADGHVCTSFCDVNQFEGVHSVQQIHAAMQFALNNIEIVVSETLGLISVREDLDDYGDSGMSYSRLLTRLTANVQQELNIITLLEYDSDLDVVMMVLLTVEEDVRYPYSPSTRIRRDVAAAVMASRHPTTGTVVLRRVKSTQVYRPSSAHLLPAFRAACALTSQWFQMTLGNLRDHCSLSLP